VSLVYSNQSISIAPTRNPPYIAEIIIIPPVPSDPTSNGWVVFGIVVGAFVGLFLLIFVFYKVILPCF
jgi:hypothetical protein